MKYVAGFLFNQDMTQVVLIKKEKPAWMRGLLNGVGGKIEEGEEPLDAMCREFFEETGLRTYPSDWDCYCVLTHAGALIYFYRGRHADMWQVRCTTKEQVRVVSVEFVLTGRVQTMKNLPWLVAMARDADVEMAGVLDRSEPHAS